MAHTAYARRLTGVPLAAALLFGFAGCGGGGNGGEKTTPPPSATAPASPSAGTGRTSAAEEQVRTNWEKFFSPDTSIDDKAKFLEDGDRLKPLLQAFSTDDRVSKVKAAVHKVKLTSPTEATVTYSLSLARQEVLPNATGTSVLQDNVWKVSDKSLCALVGMDNAGGSPIPGC